MILHIKPILTKNLLWNGMSHADLGQLFETYEPLLDAVKENKFVDAVMGIAKKSYSDPLLGPIIFLGIIPIVLSIIGLILCLIINVPVCCCEKYYRYMKTQKKLDKKLVTFIKTNKIPYDFKPFGKKRRDTMFDACAETDDLVECVEINELNNLHDKADGLYLKAFKCQCWALSFYILFFVTMFVYIITMFYLALGAKSVTQLPVTIYNSVQHVSKSATTQITSTFQSIDTSINALTGTTEQPIPLFVSLMNGTKQQYNDNLKSVETNALDLKELHPFASSVDDLLERNKNTSLNNEKSLARWLENLLFWPQSETIQYVVDGNSAGRKLHSDIYNMNNDVFIIGQNIKYITGNVSEFPQEIKNNVPIDKINNVTLSNVSELISSSSSGSGQQDLVNVIKLLEKKDLNKYVFANAFMKVIQNQTNGKISITDDMIKVFINKTLVNKQLEDVQRDQPLYEIMEPFLGADMLNLLNGDTLLQQIKQMLNSSNIFISLTDYQPFLHSLNRISTLTVDQFLEELASKQCSDFWCGLLPEGTFEKINVLLKNIPVVGNMLAYKEGPSELLKNSQPLVVAICTLIPIIIIISLTISMACCKGCCPICSMFCCSVCSVIVSIISIILLMLSFLNSGLIQSVSYKMEKDNFGLVNSFLKIGRDLGIIKQQSIIINLPSSDLLTISPQQLSIPLTNVSEILASINFTISLNTKKENSSGNDFMAMLFPNGFNLTVDLEGMDINLLFSGGKSRSILQLIKGENGNLLNDIQVKLTEVINTINVETISNMFGDALNITSKFNIDEILNQVNITQIFDELNKNDFSGISQQLGTTITTVKDFIVVQQAQNESNILFNKVSKEIQNLTQNTHQVPNVSNLIDIKINGTTNLNLLDQVYLNLILQFLSEHQGFDGITNVTDYYQKAFMEVQNNNYSVYDNIQNKYCSNTNKSFDDFGKFYVSLNCTNTSQTPPQPINPDFDNRYNQSLQNRNITNNSSNCSACKIIMCQVTKTLIEADIFNYKAANNSTYSICDALSAVKKLRTSITNIEKSIQTVKTNVDKMIQDINTSVQNSFAATAQTNLETFFKSIFSNIDQTIQLHPEVSITTIYDVLTNSGMIQNIQNPLGLVRDQLISLCTNVISTGFTNIVPSSISQLGNGILGFFDNLSVAAYFGFLFYFIGCQMCICFSLQMIRRCNYERYIKKNYQVIRPRFNCCGNAFHSLDTFKQTRHDYIPTNNYLQEVYEDQEDQNLIQYYDGGLILTPAISMDNNINPMGMNVNNVAGTYTDNV